MNAPPPASGSTWQKLAACADIMGKPENHLRHLLASPARLARYSREAHGFFYDFSRQRVNDEVFSLLLELAGERQLTRQFADMTGGVKVNTTENRAALHTAARSFSAAPLPVDGRDVMAQIREIREDIRAFSEKVHAGRLLGATGKVFRHVVVVGIGGSYLGTAFVSEALRAHADQNITLHYLANVDVHNFGRIAREIDPESTLWIIISKSYTTSETMANEALARAFMAEKGLSPKHHFVTVTAEGSPGDRPGGGDVLAAFHMFDFIGGRYSVTSAVGGVPLSLYLGYERFEAFLQGAQRMDRHAAESPASENIPLIAALISIWNNNFLGYPAQGIIPYADPLSKLAPHIQQLNMESNGKSATAEGTPLETATGPIVFGEPGTNAQHSFFQLAHQGRPFPIDFIGVRTPQYPQYRQLSKGVTNHQELWANLISQPMALAVGKESRDPARAFPGNRPSTTIVLPDLSPESVGMLLSFYEAKTVFEAFIWGINPFDQFGVELGKTLASGIRKEMALKNRNAGHGFDALDPISRFYLERLFTG